MEKAAIPEINKRIQEIRSVLALSQVKFASIITMSSGYIAGVETGRIEVNERFIKLVCSSFNASETWLRYGEGDMFLETLPDDQRFKNLVTTVKALPPKYQNFLFQVLDMLLKLKDNK
jgi:transcriptional regulator with XRE-family HTH domain